MGNVWASAAGLRALAGVFGEQAVQVSTNGGAPPVTSDFAASAAAVRSVNRDVDDAVETIAHRLAATGALVGTARAGYESTDAANAFAIGAVAGSLDVVGED